MAGILKLLDLEFKTTMINMLKALMDKIDSIQEQMGNVSRKMKRVERGKNLKNAEEQHYKIKNVSDELINRLDMTEERIAEFSSC